MAKVGNDEGMKSCSFEPCLFTGLMKSGPCVLIVYDDDLFGMAENKRDVDEIFNLIRRACAIEMDRPNPI